MLTANTTHYIITMFCVKNKQYVEVNNMYVTLWSYTLSPNSAQISDSWDRDTIHRVTRYCTINMILKLLFYGQKVKNKCCFWYKQDHEEFIHYFIDVLENTSAEKCRDYLQYISAEEFLINPNLFYRMIWTVCWVYWVIVTNCYNVDLYVFK